MKANNAIASVTGWRRLGTLLALAIGIIATTIPLPAMEEIPYQVSLQRTSLDRPAGGGGGGDIVVFDIIDSIAKTNRPAGGGGGEDIIVFDIVDSVAETNRPAGGGVGGDIIVFDIVDSVARIYVYTESSAPDVYLAILVEGERKLLGLVSFEEPSRGQIVLKFVF